jgi:hypothetical protein
MGAIGGFKSGDTSIYTTLPCTPKVRAGQRIGKLGPTYETGCQPPCFRETVIRSTIAEARFFPIHSASLSGPKTHLQVFQPPCLFQYVPPCRAEYDG